MNLYHFCAAYSMRNIMQEGITEGMTPILIGEELTIDHPAQWLTLEPDARKQRWNTKQLITIDRTAYRLTVRIPESYKKKLLKASEYIKEFPEENWGLVFDWEGSENWYVYRGRIPPHWIIGAHKIVRTLEMER